jgi:hypothetical protein
MDMTEPADRPPIRPFLNRAGNAASNVPTQRPASDPAGLRPFVLTAGRVYDAQSRIGPETQVVVRRDGLSRALLSPESTAIVEVCDSPTSVAEVSARLGLHLGVTRVLVGDLQTAGVIRVYTMDTTEPHSPETILRVMRGLRAIS